MRTKIKRELAVLIVSAIGAIDAAYAQNSSDRLLLLVETSAHRLEIAKQVALAKWDNHTPVEDVDREAQVIMAAVKDGESKGMNREVVSKFFAAQIEANKVVQYSLLADWRRVGRAPAHEPINLATTLRPVLDRLQKDLVEELAETDVVRRSATCNADTAKAVGRYLTEHKKEVSPLQAIALDRAMAATCISE